LTVLPVHTCTNSFLKEKPEIGYYLDRKRGTSYCDFMTYAEFDVYLSA